VKLLVTGAAGFMGSDFVRLTLEEGRHKVVVLDALTYAGNLQNLAPVAEHPNFRFIRGDVCSADAVRSALEDSEAVVHFAAESHVDRSIHGDRPFIQTNVEGTRVLLSEARKAEVSRFMLISTDEVYGQLEWRDPSAETSAQAVRRFRDGEADAPGFFTEESSFAPRSPYAASKAAADHLGMAYYHTHALPVIVTRSSNNYGPYQHPEKLIPRAIHHALTGAPIPLYGDGQNVRDWLHVRDHSRGVLAALDRGVPGAAYNLGGLSERTNVQVVGAILTQMGLPDDRVQQVSDRPGHDRRYAVDPLRASKELGWEPSTEFEDGLTETVSWYLDHREWWQ